MRLTSYECDLFCRVVDNYGDIGVCWRLARQLANEYGWRVRLVVDDLASFARLCPMLDACLEQQTIGNVDVAKWSSHIKKSKPAKVVIEAFACELPPGYVDAMPGQTRVWLNFEYLSAEAWIEQCHGLPSPQRNGLTKYFFFPGFTQNTGGLLVERDYETRRRAFTSSSNARRDLLDRLGVAPSAQSVVALAFCYPSAAFTQWCEALDAMHSPVTVLVPVAPREIASSPTSRCVQIPFVAQKYFDDLLWSCDFAIVRGEDSFVRAQLAGLPFIWHIYPQNDDAHLQKLAAFVDHYTQGLDEQTATAWREANFAWNTSAFNMDHGRRFLSALPVLHGHARTWAHRLHNASNLAERLTQFVTAKL
ncbi:MAG TPA: elongation factor P maturation arginine rhamnosyltransferase EarP [Burkholderiaceae bacterium]|nr:elongation factor P maturation arginine rhamnosyltransferase EarP [Burkholderiaceae bacterium]